MIRLLQFTVKDIQFELEILLEIRNGSCRLTKEKQRTSCDVIFRWSNRGGKFVRLLKDVVIVSLLIKLKSYSSLK